MGGHRSVRNSFVEAPRHKDCDNDAGNPSDDAPDSQLGAEQVGGRWDGVDKSVKALEREGRILKRNSPPYLSRVASGDICLRK